MTPMMSLFLRCLLAIALLVVLLSLSNFALAATPVDTVHDALHAMGPQAQHFVDLWRVFLAACVIVFVAILVGVWLAINRAPRALETTPADLSMVNRAEPGPKRGVTQAVIVASVALVALIVASVFTDRALAHLPLKDAVHIEVTGHQWWWTARYLDGDDTHAFFATANEIHIPVGRPVIMKLQADDVIHTLWVPNLAGKKDLIPGRTALLELRADKPGIYRGQCAEFCGLEHALMGVLVIAEPPDQFLEWQKSQREPARTPTDAKALRGMQVFQSVSCAMCHSIEGADFAGAQHAPDLTHVASRRTLAALALANTPQNMAAWIRDPQRFKAGTAMPATPLSQDDLDAVVAYLEGLQ